MLAGPATEILDRVETPRGEWALRLRREPGRRSDVYEIIANGTFLMDSGESTSERELARVGVPERAGARVFIGGLGIGFTLRACLERAHVAHVEVVEIEPALVRWVRGPLAHLTSRAIEDGRVTITVGDVYDVIEHRQGELDAVLLDIDNGPDWLVEETNARMYERAGLTRLAGALRPGGHLAVWSANDVAAFAADVRGVFGNVSEHRVETERDGRCLEYVIYVAIKEASR